MAKKKAVKKKAKVETPVKKEKLIPIPPVLHKFKCLACGSVYEDVGKNNVSTCPDCKSDKTDRIG